MSAAGASAPPAPLPDERLRVIGRYLDERDYHLRSLSVLAAGVIVTCAPREGQATGEALLFTDADVGRLRANARNRRGTPPQHTDPPRRFATGAEDVLRALGALATQYHWPWLRLLRLDTGLLLHYGARTERTEWLLQEQDIHQLLTHAVRRRATGSGTGPWARRHGESPRAARSAAS